MMGRMRVSRAVVDEVMAAGRRAAPGEVCGLLVGTEAGRASDWIPVRNSARAPGAFLTEGASLLAALAEVRARAWRVAAVVHTHAKGPAVPGLRDLAGHRWPGVPAVIVALSCHRPAVRGWHIAGGGAREIEVTIER